MASETLSIGLASGRMGLSRLVALNRSDRYAMLSPLGKGGNDGDVHGVLLGRNVVNPESENKWSHQYLTAFGQLFHISHRGLRPSKLFSRPRF
jgi:hypothetical protein